MIQKSGSAEDQQVQDIPTGYDTTRCKEAGLNWME